MKTSSKNKTTTSTKMFLLGLLSIQIGIQPILMGWYARQALNVRLRVGVIEAMKLSLALFPLILSGQVSKEMKNWHWRAALHTTALPALIYVLQNYLNQMAVVLLDGVTFNILNQTKIIWTALLVYVMLRQYQSRQQIVALIMLCGAAVLMTTGISSSDKKPKDENEATSDATFFTGAYQALIAAILSALAGTVIQRALQNQKRNAYVVTAELSLLGELTLLTWIWLAPTTTSSKTTTTDTSVSMWDGWTLMTFMTLLCQATGGVLVGFVIKHCGNVEKSFAVVVGMILTALLEHHYNAKPFGTQGIVAIFMVALSTVIYTKYPPTKGTSSSKLPLHHVVPPLPSALHSSSSSTTTSTGSSTSKRKHSEDSVFGQVQEGEEDNVPLLIQEEKNTSSCTQGMEAGENTCSHTDSSNLRFCANSSSSNRSSSSSSSSSSSTSSRGGEGVVRIDYRHVNHAAIAV